MRYAKIDSLGQRILVRAKSFTGFSVIFRAKLYYSEKLFFERLFFPFIYNCRIKEKRAKARPPDDMLKRYLSIGGTISGIQMPSPWH
jgi:hypothetical protein